MLKRRWLIISLLVAVVAIGIPSGVVFAQENGTQGHSPLESFASRVAAILELDETVVQDAFVQATRQIQDEALQKRLGHLVEKGRLTQEQADAYMEWYRSRPEALSPRFPFLRFGGHRFFLGHGTGGDSPSEGFASRVAVILELDETVVQDAFSQATRQVQDERLQRRLDHLVEKGLLTQEQADTLTEWYQSRPENISPRFPFLRFGGYRLFYGHGMGDR